MEREADIGHIDRPSQHNQEQDSLQQLDEQRPGSDPQPSCSSQVSGRLQRTYYAEVNRRLEQFVEYFVEEFEAKLYAYHMILEGKTTKAGKLSDTFSEKIGQEAGGAAGGLVGFFLGSPETGAKVGKLGGKKIGSMLGNKKNAEEVIKLTDLVDYFQNNKTKFRLELVEAGFDVFQSFEMQFMRVTIDQEPKGAIHQLAKDAVNRAINYMKQKNDKTISESVILGDSKKKILSIMPGFKIQYGYQLYTKVWNTASLYGKAGIVLEDGSYYKQKRVEGGTTRYGYRRLLVQENWEKLKHKYGSDNIAESKSVLFTDYQYAISPKDYEKQTKVIFDNLNNKDKNLKEHRIKTILEEVRNEILEELDILRKLSREDINDRKILTEIKANIKDLNIDEYLEKFKQYFEDAKQERKKISESIETGRVENNENFIHLSHKQDTHHGDNKREHKKTQEMLVRVEKGIERVHIDFAAQRSKQTAEAIWFDVKNPVDSFTGRVEQLKQLHELLQSTSEKSISQTVSVTGLGGIGKTNLARKYAYDHRTDYDGNVIWVNAETHQTLTESFLKLAQNNLGINVKDSDGKQKELKDIIINVYRFFSKRKSLFIFDNAEKFRTQEDSDGGINTFLPSSGVNKPYILITSRNQKWGDIKQLILGTFTPTESINFIRYALEINDESQENEIKKLTETLQHYPLALQQAVAYIKERVRALKNVGLKFEISDYLKRYDNEITKLLDFNFPDDSNDLYTKTTFKTWKITTNKIKENNEYGTQAGEILDIIAYLAPDGIPVQMFLALELIGDNPEQLGHAVQLLKQYSMVNSGQEQTVLNVHRLVQEVTRIELERQGKNEDIIQKAFDLLSTNFPYGKNTSKDYLKKREMLPHLELFLLHLDNWIAKNPKNERKIEKDYLANILTWISNGYTDLGDPQKQKNLLERALAIDEKYLGPDHVNVAITLVNLGIVYGDLGYFQKQKNLLEGALAIDEKYYGPDHVNVAITLEILGIVYGNLGYLQKKKDFFERALAINEKYYGPDNVEVARSLVYLGNAYGDLGYPQKRKNLLERALAIKEKYYGPDHVEVATTLSILGYAYGDLGDPQKKKDLLERVLAIDEKYYRLDNVKVARSLECLGNAYGDLGYPQKQKDLLERALAIDEKYYGPDHVGVAIVLVNLGNAYGDLGDPQKQKNLLERALAIKEKYYAPDHAEVAVALVNLGHTYGALGDPQKQKDLLERALAINEKYYGPDHVKVAKALVDLGYAYGDLGDPQKQKNLLERALAIDEKYYGPDNVEVAVAIDCLGKAYGRLGDPQKQKDLLERALAINEKYYGPDHVEVARSLVFLGNAYADLGYPQKQKNLLERALAIKEKYYGPDHVEVATTLSNLGHAYGDLGDPQKKKDLLERVLAIDEKYHRLDNVKVARSLECLGNAYGDLGYPQKQKDLLERALAINEKYYGPDNVGVAIVLVNLGNAYGDLGDPQKQKNLLERALAIKEKYYGPDHVEVAVALVNLGNTYGALGDPQKQKDLLERALAIYEKYYGPDHVKVAIALVNLGNAYGGLGDPQKQKNLIERALAIDEKYYGPDHVEVAITLRCLGQAHGNLGDPQKAYEFYVKSSKITEKQTPLHLATEWGDLKTVEYMLEAGADVFARNYHDTVLHQAVSSGNEEVIRLIVETINEKHAQKVYEHVNAKDTEGDTPLMWAAKFGRTNAAKILLEYGVDLNVQNNDGETALHWAVKGAHVECVQLLLDSKADSSIQNNNGETPLILCQAKLSEDLDDENLQKITGLLLRLQTPESKPV